MAELFKCPTTKPKAGEDAGTTGITEAPVHRSSHQAPGKVRSQIRPFIKLTARKTLSQQKLNWLPGNGPQDGQAGTGRLGCFLDLSFLPPPAPPPSDLWSSY